MNFRHGQLAAGRWNELSFFEQMANIGSEVERTIKWKNRGNDRYANNAFERALELFDLTVEDGKNRGRLFEILRCREAFSDYVVGGNSFHSTDHLWRRYFFAFQYAARRMKREVAEKK